jgi:hypothetical protein
VLCFSTCLPPDHYIRYWGPDYKLHISPMAERVNCNSRSGLQATESRLLQQLKELGGPPSVQYSTYAGRDSAVHGWQEDRAAEQKEDASMDSSADGAVKGRQHQSEFFSGNKDQDRAEVDAMGIVRPKPSGSLAAPHVPVRNTNVAAPAAPAAAAAAAVHVQTSTPMEQ